MPYYHSIEIQSLDVPESALQYRDQGIGFQPVDERVIDDFLLTCSSLEAVATEIGAPTPEKRPVMYLPHAVLLRALTGEQVAFINERETPEVAKYIVGVQADIAKVPIEESGDPMVYLPSVLRAQQLTASYSEVPFHQACGEWAGKGREFWVRNQFADRLTVFATLLEAADVQLHFEDAFRPLGVQEGLFRRRVQWTRDAYPDWTEEQIIDEAKSKTAVTPRLASHKGGAAVDATLRNANTGQPLDFGHKYPDGGAIVFPKTPFLTMNQWRNRQLFQVAAGLSDLTLYIGEDWHVSYGDNLASLDENGQVRLLYTAQYGPVKDFDRQSGEITGTYDAEELDTLFDY